jgi:ABC-type cobalamin/Fe3+-siderophores transport system ATPase subunit
MQLKRLAIRGLFGTMDHTIQFPVPGEQASTPSLVILHGRNGVGKTTILRMLDGLLRLDFNTFRQIPIASCVLDFDSNDSLEVKPHRNERLVHIDVSFRGLHVQLHPDHPGALNDEEDHRVEVFRQLFFKQTEDITFEFIDTERLYQLQPHFDEFEDAVPPHLTAEISRTLRSPLGRKFFIRHSPPNPKARFPEPPQSLAARVKRFIREAQVNYRTFFSTTEPDLFPRIIDRLTAKQQPIYAIDELRERLQRIHAQDKENERLGLEPDRWDYDQMMAQLEALAQRSGEGRQQALTVLGSYVEQLESRAAERALVADRLLTFERLMKEFLGDKSIAIDPRVGIQIRAQSGEKLEERQLSSGEFHLLFLMIAALVTRRRGTVIAIDEPEMSMHIAWQRRLIPALVECASKAEPLFIFATHSPDLAASFPDAMIELK